MPQEPRLKPSKWLALANWKDERAAQVDEVVTPAPAAISPEPATTASLSFLKLHVRHARFETKMSAIRKGEPVELFFFARFHASPGRESALQEALKEVVVPSREEAGCLSIHAFRSNSDPCLFFIHSRWKDEAAFDCHGSLPHTLRFLERATQLIDHPLDLTRTTLIA